MGVNTGKTRPAKLLGLALLEVARDFPIATDIFQSGFLERPNAKVEGQRCEALLSLSNLRLGWWQMLGLMSYP
jgi:hypothetical protein